MQEANTTNQSEITKSEMNNINQYTNFSYEEMEYDDLVRRLSWESIDYYIDEFLKRIEKYEKINKDFGIDHFEEEILNIRNLYEDLLLLPSEIENIERCLEPNEKIKVIELLKNYDNIKKIFEELGIKIFNLGIKKLNLENIEYLNIKIEILGGDYSVMEYKYYDETGLNIKFKVFDLNVLNSFYERLYEANNLKSLVFKGDGLWTTLESNNKYLNTEQYEFLGNYIKSNPANLKKFILEDLYPNEIKKENDWVSDCYLDFLNCFKFNTNLEEIKVPVPYFLRKSIRQGFCGYEGFLKNRSLNKITFYLNILLLSTKEYENIKEMVKEVLDKMIVGVVLYVYEPKDDNSFLATRNERYLEDENFEESLFILEDARRACRGSALNSFNTQFSNYQRDKKRKEGICFFDKFSKEYDTQLSFSNLLSVNISLKNEFKKIQNDLSMSAFNELDNLLAKPTTNNSSNLSNVSPILTNSIFQSYEVPFKINFGLLMEKGIYAFELERERLIKEFEIANILDSWLQPNNFQNFCLETEDFLSAPIPEEHVTHRKSRFNFP